MHGSEATTHERPDKGEAEENVPDCAALGDSAAQRLTDPDLLFNAERVENGENPTRTSAFVQHKQQISWRCFSVEERRHAIGKRQQMPVGQQRRQVSLEASIPSRPCQ